MEFTVRNAHELRKQMKEAGYKDSAINVYTNMFQAETNGEEQTITVSAEPQNYD